MPPEPNQQNSEATVEGCIEAETRKPCVHDSRRLDGWLDSCCMRCGAAGYWRDGEPIPHPTVGFDAKAHPGGKTLIREQERSEATVGVEVPEEGWLVKLAEGVIDGLYERPEECATEPEIARAVVAAVEQAIRAEEREKVREAAEKWAKERRAMGDKLARMVPEEPGDNVRAANIELLLAQGVEKFLATLENCGGVGSDITGDAPHDESHAHREECPDCDGTGNRTHVGAVGHAVTFACRSCDGTGKADRLQKDEAVGVEWTADEKALLIARLARGKTALPSRAAEEDRVVEKLMASDLGAGWGRLCTEQAVNAAPDCQPPDSEERVQRVAKAISAHLTTDDDLQEDFCVEVARDVLGAVDAPKTFPPSHFAHRFKEPEPNALISQPPDSLDRGGEAELKEKTGLDRLRHERDVAVFWLRQLPKAMEEEAAQAPSEQVAELLGRWANRIGMIAVAPPTQADLDWAKQVVAERDLPPLNPDPWPPVDVHASSPAPKEDSEGDEGAELASLRGELATLLGPRQPRPGVTANDQWIAAVGEVLAERDARLTKEQCREKLDSPRWIHLLRRVADTIEDPHYGYADCLRALAQDLAALDAAFGDNQPSTGGGS